MHNHQTIWDFIFWKKIQFQFRFIDKTKLHTSHPHTPQNKTTNTLILTAEIKLYLKKQTENIVNKDNEWHTKKKQIEIQQQQK